MWDEGEPFYDRNRNKVFDEALTPYGEVKKKASGIINGTLISIGHSFPTAKKTCKVVRLNLIRITIVIGIRVNLITIAIEMANLSLLNS